MFHGPQPDETTEQDPPCEACGQPGPFLVWDRRLCGECVNAWRSSPEPEVCRQPPAWKVARGEAKENSATFAEREVAWRASVEAFIAARKASAA